MTNRKNMAPLDLMQQKSKIVLKLLEEQSKSPLTLEIAKRQVERIKRKKIENNTNVHKKIKNRGLPFSYSCINEYKQSLTI